ncbi:hypothetical protein LSCM4_07828 [Leishmania orientalis]|uniref:Uncharacterized protein n=1 Tax=Leishmania orientalis TaxID=2249476 RepID=A0A836HTJ3_9TRYP|nr:hypothetical protein LSCM4_07828 [Leishmania orientalis]
MSSHANSNSAHGVRVNDTETAVSCNFKRRRILCCAAPIATVQVTNLCLLDTESNDLWKSTVCMDYHILSRIEDDLRRAEMRQDNPESAIPSRGYEYEQEAYRIAEEYRAQQLLGSGHLIARPYSSGGKGLLPCIKPHSTRSRRSSASNNRHASGDGSAVHRLTGNHFSVPSSSNTQGNRRSRMTGWGRRAHLRLCASPLQRKGSNPARQSKSPYSFNARLKPIESAYKTPTRQSKEEDYHEGGNGAGAAGSAHRPDKRLPWTVPDLTEPEWCTVNDTEREQRLRLADELADLMESAAL